jgi:hypothetical protein
LIIHLSERFPTPLPEEYAGRITTKGQTCEAQISTEETLSIDTDEIMTEYLPPLLQSVYYRILSKPETVSEDEYSVLFLTLSRVGFDSETIADFVPFKTDIGKNYTLELINQSSLNRREPIPEWESIEEICHGVTQKKDGYRSVCQNPVMYYQLKGTFS